MPTMMKGSGLSKMKAADEGNSIGKIKFNILITLKIHRKAGREKQGEFIRLHISSVSFL